MEGRAGAGVGLQPRRRRGQAGPLHVRAGSRVRQAEEVRDHAQVWRRFLLRKCFMDVFVIKGFYACVREQFTKCGTAIYYYPVEWNSDQLKWEDFRGKVLGGTDGFHANWALVVEETLDGPNVLWTTRCE